MSKYFGIDFGTTTTAFYCYDDDTRSYIPFGNMFGDPYHSVVAIDRVSGEVTLKGTEAWMKKAELETDANSIVVSSVKQKLLENDTWKTIERIWTPEMVATEILKIGTGQIRSKWPDIEYPLTAVMAVPVDFRYEERTAIWRAAKDAGIIISQFVSEPTAALIGSDEDLSDVQKILVFDWGGGTLDVSVLSKSFEKISEIDKTGNRKAGDDIDKLFAQWLHNEHISKLNINTPFDSVAPSNRDRLITLSEREKKHLSDDKNVGVILPNYLNNSSLSRDVSRSEFESLITDIVGGLERTVMDALGKARCSPEEIDLVLVVGGSSKIPLVKRRLEDLFGARCVYPQKPEWCIAKGAANLARKKGSYALSSDVGIILSDGTFYPVIRKSLPIEHQPATITLGLVEDSKEARVMIAERKNPYDHDIQLMDVITLPTHGFNFEPIEVTFEIETSLSMKVTVADILTREKRETFRDYTQLKFEYLLNQYE